MGGFIRTLSGHKDGLEARRQSLAAVGTKHVNLDKTGSGILLITSKYARAEREAGAGKRTQVPSCDEGKAEATEAALDVC